ADRDHRHRAVAAPRDDAATFERIEREIGLAAARADRLPDRELVALAAGADHDAAADRQQLESEPHRSRRVVFGGLLVCTSQPPRARERRPLRHPCVVFAEAEAPLGAGCLQRSLLLSLRHDRTETGAAASTSSITSPIAESMLPFSTTGTPCLRARPRM